MRSGTQIEIRILNVSPSARGGAANERGSRFRASLAAYAGAHILRGESLPDFELDPDDSVPVRMALETDDAVDDLVVTFEGGGRAYIQAKRRLETGRSFDETVDQWVLLVQQQSLDPEHDRLVAACGSASRPMRALGVALARRRRAGTLETHEQRALEQLLARLGSLDLLQRDLVLDCAAVWESDLAAPVSLAARLGAALLEPAVVAPGEGSAAWAALLAGARDLACERLGTDLDGLRELLREASLTLSAEFDGYAAARAQLLEGAIVTYRERIQRRGESLDLSAVGSTLPPIPFDQIDGKVVVTSRGSSGDGNGGLPWALRRRGRALLIGPPGAGKSVALRRTAGFYAARGDWPLPLIANLTRVVELSETSAFADALLDASLELLPRDEQPLARRVARDALERGDAVLLLDGLDEVRSERPTLLANLQGLLKDLDPAVEVLLSTREVAHTDGRMLAFAELDIVPPGDASKIARAILKACAKAERRANPDDWVALRLGWVEARLQKDGELGRTPLTVVLLSLLAARSDSDSLPASRAGVLLQIVDDILERWERGTRLKFVGDLPGQLSSADKTRAARRASLAIGSVVHREGTAHWSDVVEEVAQALREPFGLAPAVATGIADEMVRLWDEAGVFVALGARRTIAARIKLFAELGAAQLALAQSDEDLDSWVRDRAVDLEGADREPLLLACGMDPRAADRLVKLVLERDDRRLFELVDQAVAQGANVGAEERRGLVERLVADHGAGDATRLDRSRTLVRLSVEPEQQALAFGYLDSLPPARRVLMRALASVAWGLNVEETRRELTAVLDVNPDELTLPEEVEARLSIFQAMKPDADYQAAVMALATWLLESTEEDAAERLAQLNTGLSAATEAAVRQSVVLSGFGERLRPQLQQLDLSELVTAREQEEDADALLLGILADLAEPVELTREEQRRLNSLAAVVAASNFSKAPAGDATFGVLKDAGALSACFVVAAQRSGLSLAKLSAEAAELMLVGAGEPEDRMGPLYLLTDHARKLVLGSWDLVSEPGQAAAALVESVMSPYDWVGEFATRCLIGITQPWKSPTVDALAEAAKLDSTSAGRRAATAWLAVADDPGFASEMAESASVWMRLVAARWWAGKGESNAQSAGLVKALSDSHREVVEAGLAAVHRRREGGLVDDRLDLAAIAATCWTCQYCGRPSSRVRDSCPECHRIARSSEAARS